MGAEHTFSDNLHRDNCRTQGWLEAGAEFHHAETAAQELSGEIAGNILCHMKIWTGRCEKRRGHRDGWEALGGSTVCAGRKIFSVQGGRFALCLHPGMMGDQLPAKPVEGKKHRCQNKLGYLLTEGSGSSPGQQVQWDSAEEEKQWRENLKSFTTRTSSLKYQPEYSLSCQESRSVSCAVGGWLREKNQEALWNIFP